MIQLSHHDSATSILTLDRPDKRNALSVELIEQIRAAVVELAKDLNRRVLIIRGNGPSFCAGLDMKEVSEGGGAERSAEALARMYEALCDSPLVTIAAAHGAAVGGGAGIVLACDFVVAADDLKLGFPEVHRGLVAALVTTLLRRQVNDRVARELVLLGQTLDAQSAMSLSLANRVAPAAKLLDESLGLARQVCIGAPNAVVRSKRLLDELSHRPIRDELRRALRYHLQQRNSAEAREGTAAFTEKRFPKWGPREAS